MSPTHQEVSNDTTFSQIKSCVPVPLNKDLFFRTDRSERRSFCYKGPQEITLKLEKHRPVVWARNISACHSDNHSTFHSSTYSLQNFLHSPVFQSFQMLKIVSMASWQETMGGGETNPPTAGEVSRRMDNNFELYFLIVKVSMTTWIPIAKGGGSVYLLIVLSFGSIYKIKICCLVRMKKVLYFNVVD